MAEEKNEYKKILEKGGFLPASTPTPSSSPSETRVTTVEGPSDVCRRCGCWSRSTGCCGAFSQSAELGKTPRVNAVAPVDAFVTDSDQWAVSKTDYDCLLDVARELERELAERNEQLRQSCDEYRAEHGGCCASSARSSARRTDDGYITGQGCLVQSAAPVMGGIATTPGVRPPYDRNAYQPLPSAAPAEARIAELEAEVERLRAGWINADKIALQERLAHSATEEKPK